MEPLGASEVSQWAGGFATTQWTLVWTAAKEDPQSARPAFAELFGRYWQPLYYVARRQGLSPEDAEDALQQFFANLLSDSFLDKAHPTAGRFRSYLNVAWKRFLVDGYRMQAAQKRGGMVKHLSLNVAGLEPIWQAKSCHTPEIDQLFAASWAENILNQVRSQLSQEYAARGRCGLFALLIAHISQPLDSNGYKHLATQAELSSGAVKVALHRLRRRFGETLRQVIAETVASPAEIDAELDDLLAAIK